MKLPTWQELGERGIDVTVDDIIYVLTIGRSPEDTEKVTKGFTALREYFRRNLGESKGMNKAEAFALGKAFNDPDKPLESQVDFYVMTKKGILHVDEEGNQNISPKWEKVVKVAAILKSGTKKEKQFITDGLMKANASTPFNLTNE